MKTCPYLRVSKRKLTTKPKFFFTKFNDLQSNEDISGINGYRTPLGHSKGTINRKRLHLKNNSLNKSSKRRSSTNEHSLKPLKCFSSPLIPEFDDFSEGEQNVKNNTNTSALSNESSRFCTSTPLRDKLPSRRFPVLSYISNDCKASSETNINISKNINTISPHKIPKVSPRNVSYSSNKGSNARSNQKGQNVSEDHATTRLLMLRRAGLETSTDLNSSACRSQGDGSIDSDSHQGLIIEPINMQSEQINRSSNRKTIRSSASGETSEAVSNSNHLKSTPSINKTAQIKYVNVHVSGGSRVETDSDFSGEIIFNTSFNISKNLALNNIPKKKYRIIKSSDQNSSLHKNVQTVENNSHRSPDKKLEMISTAKSNKVISQRETKAIKSKKHHSNTLRSDQMARKDKSLNSQSSCIVANKSNRQVLTSPVQTEPRIRFSRRLCAKPVKSHNEIHLLNQHMKNVLSRYDPSIWTKVKHKFPDSPTTLGKQNSIDTMIFRELHKTERKNIVSKKSNSQRSTKRYTHEKPQTNTETKSKSKDSQHVKVPYTHELPKINKTTRLKISNSQRPKKSNHK